MSTLEYISDEVVKQLLDWDLLISCLKNALVAVSKKDDSVIVPPRLFLRIPEKEGVLLNMPGYSKDENSLGCKLVTSFPNNVHLGMPSIFSTILLFDSDTGKPKVAVDGRQITAWRTAAVSAISTKYMHKKSKDVLTIIGAGVQAESHALVFQHLFKFKTVRIWNRTLENAKLLVSKLPFPAEVYSSLEESCHGADVICTTTYSSNPFIKRCWLKEGVHLNAVGANENHYSELEEDIYRNAYMTVEHKESAQKELSGLLEKGIGIQCEIGEFISNGYTVPEAKVSLFQSMGLAVEDVVAANMIFSLYCSQKT